MADQGASIFRRKRLQMAIPAELTKNPITTARRTTLICFISFLKQIWFTNPRFTSEYTNPNALNPFGFCQRYSERFSWACFFRKAVGVNPVYFLKSVLKEDLELNPTSYKTSRMVIFSSFGLVKSLVASSIL